MSIYLNKIIVFFVVLFLLKLAKLQIARIGALLSQNHHHINPKVLCHHFRCLFMLHYNFFYKSSGFCYAYTSCLSKWYYIIPEPSEGRVFPKLHTIIENTIFSLINFYFYWCRWMHVLYIAPHHTFNLLKRNTAAVNLYIMHCLYCL